MRGEQTRQTGRVRGDQGAEQAVLPLRRTLALELSKLRNEALAANRNGRATDIERIIRLIQTRRIADGEIPGQETGRGATGKHTALVGAPRYAPLPSWNHLRALQQGTDIVFDKGPDLRIDRTGNPSGDGSDDRRIARRQSPDPVWAAGTGRAPSIVRADGSDLKQRYQRVLDVGDAGDQESRAILAVDRLGIDDDVQSATEKRRRKRPAAWLISLVAHGVILLLLAGIGIQVHRPKDQVTLIGSATDASERAIETFRLETREPVVEPIESEVAEVEYEISPVGDVAVAEFATEADPRAAPPMAMSSLDSGIEVDSLTSESESKVAFLGLEGGGNHFVYLVDSSKSMGDAFPSARRALIESIDALTPQQRFYVIFFDRDPDYMRITDPTTNEPRSVPATVANKASLRRWAAQISMDHGRAPYDPIRFALGLKPDVIFLLSDGEFPQKFEELVARANRVDNLFDDGLPISIIHTIGYHSEAGERRMRRIAEQHGGQYRHIPRP